MLTRPDGEEVVSSMVDEEDVRIVKKNRKRSEKRNRTHLKNQPDIGRCYLQEPSSSNPTNLMIVFRSVWPVRLSRSISLPLLSYACMCFVVASPNITRKQQRWFFFPATRTKGPPIECMYIVRARTHVNSSHTSRWKEQKKHTKQSFYSTSFHKHTHTQPSPLGPYTMQFSYPTLATVQHNQSTFVLVDYVMVKWPQESP